MSYKSLNNVIQYLQDFVTSHYQLKGFGFGNIFEINGNMKPGLQYYLLWVVPLESITTENTKQRRFNIMVLGLVKSDMSNRDEVWSDTERCMDDVMKLLRYGSEDFELVGDPAYNPVTEQHGDWVTGWQSEIVIQTDFNNNFCDIPSDQMPVIDNRNYATIYDQDGNVVTRLSPGSEYHVVIASGINEGGASQTYTVKIIDA